MQPASDDRRPGVGVGVFIVKDGKVLFGHRLSKHGYGTWAPPGGKLEFGESWEDCARREVTEETGLEIANIRFLTTTNDVYQDEGVHFVTILVACDWVAGEPEVKEPEKCERWEWVAWDQLPSPLMLVMQHFLETGINPINS